ncbi:hypothetical protein DL771_005313 [Monosporascus sp. 5C6A]|nr:hypothetical protein DL771_005313 [Monosporascus sp. 5C6A]
MHYPNAREKGEILRHVFGIEEAPALSDRSLKAYFEYYNSVLSSSPTPDAVIEVDTPTLRSYEDVCKSVKVFHQAAFLRAKLRQSKEEDLDIGFERSLQLRTLPPRLLLETLATLHLVLFPIATKGNKRCRSLLKKLIRTGDFDAEAEWIEFVRPIPFDFTFMYWGDRLTKLHELVKRPPPSNAFVSWFERHTSERNALTVAICGLFLAVLFGFLGVVIGILQLAIAWLAWKYPVQSFD